MPPPPLGPDDIEILDTRAFAESNYPLTLTVHPDARIGFHISHDAHRVAPDVVRQMLDTLRTLLERFAEHPDQPTGQIARPPAADGQPGAPRDAAGPAIEAAAGAATAARAVAPTADERTLLEIWQRIFKRDDIAITDNYFDLGGHSIIAIQLMAHVEKAFDRRLPISCLFENPTIENWRRRSPRRRRPRPPADSCRFATAAPPRRSSCCRAPAGTWSTSTRSRTT